MVFDPPMKFPPCLLEPCGTRHTWEGMITYTNRRGDVYRLYSKPTKTGKTAWFVSQKPSAAGTPAEAVPEGMEFYEHPGNAIVTVRRVQPSRIGPAEVAFVQEVLEQCAGLKLPLAFAEHGIDTITVWISQGSMTPPSRAAPVNRWELPLNPSRRPRQAEIRFILKNAGSRAGEGRTFSAERLCSRGSVDRWISLAGGPLKTLAPALCRHIGKMSFYELYPWCSLDLQGSTECV